MSAVCEKKQLISFLLLPPKKWTENLLFRMLIDSNSARCLYQRQWNFYRLMIYQFFDFRRSTKAQENEKLMKLFGLYPIEMGNYSISTRTYRHSYDN